jgi:hypothetical protein
MSEAKAHVARTADGLTHLNTLAPAVVRLRLFDPFTGPMPRARYRVTLADRTIEGHADAAAWVEFRVLEIPETCVVEWDDDEAPLVVVDDPDPPAGSRPESPAEKYIDPAWVGPVAEPPTAATDAYRYKQEVYLELEVDDEEAAFRRLHNLGFTLGERLREHIREFEKAYDRVAAGELSGVQETLWDWHDTGGVSRCTRPRPLA